MKRSRSRRHGMETQWRSPLVMGLLSGATAVAVWLASVVGFSRLFERSLGSGLADVSSWPFAALFGGGGFLAGAFGGAYLGRHRAWFPVWMYGGGALTGLTGLAFTLLSPIDPIGWTAILLTASAGFFAGFLARLMPDRACDPLSMRYAVVTAIVRLAPCLTATVALLVLAFSFSLRQETMLFGEGLSLLGFTVLWAFAGQEHRIMQLERKLNRLLASGGCQPPASWPIL